LKITIFNKNKVVQHFNQRDQTQCKGASPYNFKPFSSTPKCQNLWP